MNNLFSIFDPNVYGALTFPVNWLTLGFPALIVPASFWLAPSRPLNGAISLLESVEREMRVALGEGVRPGTTGMPLVLFLFIILSNLLGLLPYVFTPASHFSATAAMALPLWGGHLLVSALKAPRPFFAHLVPAGTPSALIPFMVLVEAISSGIRPLTLSIRLAANLVAGHLLISLLGSAASTAPLAGGAVVLLLAMIPLLSLELGVAAIQAYVFTLLSTLYVQEVSPNSLS